MLVCSEKGVKVNNVDHFLPDRAALADSGRTELDKISVTTHFRLEIVNSKM